MEVRVSPYTGEGCRIVSNFGYDAQHRKGILYGNQTLGSMSILLDGHFEINSEGKSGGSTHTGEGCRMVTIFEPAAQHRMGIISESQTSGSMSIVAEKTLRIQLWEKVGESLSTGQCCHCALIVDPSYSA